MPKKHPYTCPRCEYFTSKRTDMNKHLFKLIKPCPAINHNIELTDEIKKHILDNRVYNPPKQPTPQQVINQQINNYQLIVNYINKKDFQDKISQYLEYTNDDLLNYTDVIDELYKDNISRRKDEQHNFNKNKTLGRNDLIDVVHNCTSPDSVSKMNLSYDKVLNKLHIFDDDEWISLHFESGVQELIKSIQYVYLNHYEEQLLKQYISASCYDKQCIQETLIQYYQFLEAFNVLPIIKSYNDEWIQDLYDNDIGKIYNNVKDEIKGSERNNIKKKVFNVIKNNCHESVLELNKQMMELIKMDETFKNNIMNELRQNTAI